MSGGASHGTRLSTWFDTQRLRAPAPTRWWLATLGFGIATLLVSLSLTQIFPQSGNGFASGYGSAVIAFEFARGQADLLAIFGPDSDPAQVARLAAMRTGNERDYLFMLLYAAFLVSGLMALWRELRLRMILAAVALPLFAALCDAWENWLLLDIQAAFTAGDYSPAMASLPYPVAAKFLALAATNIAIGLAMARIGRWWQLAGTLVILACIATPMALIAPPAFGWALVAATGGGWIALLGMAAIGSWQALARGRPLVDFERGAPIGKPAAPIAAPAPGARKAFGRRKSGR